MKLLLTTCKTCILNFLAAIFLSVHLLEFLLHLNLWVIFLVYCYNENVKVMERNNIYLFIYFLKSLGGNIISRKSTSDLNPILAAGNCMLNLASQGKRYPFSVLAPDVQDGIVKGVRLGSKWLLSVG